MLREQKTDCRYLTSIGGIDYSVNIYNVNSCKPNVMIHNSRGLAYSPIQFSGDLPDLVQFGELIKEIIRVAQPSGDV